MHPQCNPTRPSSSAGPHVHADPAVALAPLCTPGRQRNGLSRVAVQRDTTHVAAVLHTQVRLERVGIRCCASRLGRGTRRQPASCRAGGRRQRRRHSPGGRHRCCCVTVQRRRGGHTSLEASCTRCCARRPPQALLGAQRPGACRGNADHACKFVDACNSKGRPCPRHPAGPWGFSRGRGSHPAIRPHKLDREDGE